MGDYLPNVSEAIIATDISSGSQDFNQSEASDEASENELLDKSLSLWKGWGAMDRKDDFTPVPLDVHTACSLGLLETVKLLAGRCNMDAKNKGGWTPLMYACYIGHYAVVDYLLGNGVDVNAKNHKGQTPLILAASCGNESVGHLLCGRGVQLEARDKNGASALLHATYSGHQNMVLFLLEQGANINSVEPTFGVSPLMQAAAEGHEIIVQIFLNHGVDVEAKAYNGDTARSVALLYGHTKIVSLIDNHVMATMRTRSSDRMYSDLGGCDDAHLPHRHQTKMRCKGPSIRDGPEAFARYLDHNRNQNSNGCIPHGYMTFNCNAFDQENTPHIRSRDMTSPINPDDYTLDSSGEKDALNDDGSMAFSKTGAITIKSSSSSSGGLAAALGLSRESSQESLEEKSNGAGNKLVKHREDSAGSFSEIINTSATSAKSPSNTNIGKNPGNTKTGKTMSNTNSCRSPSNTNSCRSPSNTNSCRSPSNTNSCRSPSNTNSCRSPSNTNNISPSQIADFQSRNILDDVPSFYSSTPLTFDPDDTRPKDVASFLEEIGLSRYMELFEEQDVDFPVLLSLTENHLSEIGVKLFGHRRKMAIAITRWHSHAPKYSEDSLEQVYANRLECEMQETATALHRTYEQMEELKAQLLQEEELRSVTETCLMEEKAAWQRVHRVVMDTRQHCYNMHDNISHLKSFYSELHHRLKNQSNWSTPYCHGDVNSLAYAIKDSFSLGDSSKQTCNTRQMTSEVLDSNIDTILNKMQESVAIATMNCDMLLRQTSVTNSSLNTT